MAKFCGMCGSPLSAAAIFCRGCGNKVPGAAPSSATAPVVPPASDPAGLGPAMFNSAPEPASEPGGFSPVPAAFVPAPQASPDPGGFAPVSPSSFSSVSEDTFAAAGFGPIPPAFTPAPMPPSEPVGFAPLPPAFTPAPPSGPGVFAPLPPAFAPAPPVQASYGSTTATPSAIPGYAPVEGASAPPPSFTPAPPSDPGGFAPLPPAFSPAPPVQASYGSVAATPSATPGYAPVAGASAPQPPAYAPSPATYPAAPAYAPAQANYPPAQANYAPGNAYPTAKKSNTLLKVVIALVLVLFVGGALALAGLWYAAQQIKAKAHGVTARVLGGNPSGAGALGGILGASTASDEKSAAGISGDPCRFLSKAEVSQAVGVTIIRAEAANGSCSYIAKGDPADIAAKHTAALMGEMGVDAKSQKIAQQFAGAFFGQQQAGDKDLSAEAAKGEVPVLGVSFTSGNAALEMKMNRGAFARVRGGATFGQGDAPSAKRDTGDLTGIGDDALVVAGSAILVRKGNVVVHFMFPSCPCSTSSIKPLAKMVADRL